MDPTIAGWELISSTTASRFLRISNYFSTFAEGTSLSHHFGFFLFSFFVYFSVEF